MISVAGATVCLGGERKGRLGNSTKIRLHCPVIRRDGRRGWIGRWRVADWSIRIEGAKPARQE
jgi:hypothetical protein